MEREPAGEGNAQQKGAGNKQTTHVGRNLQELGGEDKLSLRQKLRGDILGGAEWSEMKGKVPFKSQRAKSEITEPNRQLNPSRKLLQPLEEGRPSSLQTSPSPKNTPFTLSLLRPLHGFLLQLFA